MARFYIGQPVVCINDKISHEIRILYPNNKWPVQGQKYHVREYVPIRRGHPAILVHEIRNSRVCYFDGTIYEGGFAEFRFAPVTDEQVRALMTVDVPSEHDLHPTMEPEDA